MNEFQEKMISLSLIDCNNKLFQFDYKNYAKLE